MNIKPINTITCTNQIQGMPKETGNLSPKEQKQLWQACQGLEAYFAKCLLKEVGKSPAGMDAGAGGEIYKDMFQESVANSVASTNSLGIAKTVYNQVIHISEKVGSKHPEAIPSPTQTLKPV